MAAQQSALRALWPATACLPLAADGGSLIFVPILSLLSSSFPPKVIISIYFWFTLLLIFESYVMSYYVSELSLDQQDDQHVTYLPKFHLK